MHPPTQFTDVLLALFSLVPVYLFFKAFCYPVFVKKIWGEDEFYGNPAYRHFMFLFVFAGLCPHPGLSNTEKRKWEKKGWRYAVLAVLSFIAIAVIGGFMAGAPTVLSQIQAPNILPISAQSAFG